MRYRRANIKGGSYFFTVNLADRKSDVLIKHVDTLRHVIQTVKQHHSFEIDAMVVLPDHLHAIWFLPEGDADYPKRWMLIKSGFSRQLPPREYRRKNRTAKGERGIWQRRYWEHCIRDERDFERHVDYIHYNPVKHGYVTRAVDWSYSSLHRYIDEGVVGRDRGIAEDVTGNSYGERG